MKLLGRGSQAVFAAVLFIVFCSTVTDAPSAGAATSNAAVQALARSVAGYQRSVTSPIVDVDHRLTAVALVTPSGATTAAIEILRYDAPAWKVEQRIGQVELLVVGHSTAERESPMDWIHVFNLGAARPAFALYLGEADHWNGLVVGKLTSRWEIVPFQAYGRGELPYPVFHSPSDVTTEVDNNVPSHAAGTFTWRLFRFDSSKSSFLQVGPVRTGVAPR